jgi:hypothetical protein
MPSSYSSRLRFELQFTGENINLWGDKLDSTFSRVDDSIAGYVALTIAASGNYTLSSTNSNTSADEARMAHLELTGSPSANFSVIIPAVAKNYWIKNATAKVATITTGSGGTATIEAGDKLPVWCDGTNVNDGLYYGGLNLKNFIAASVLAATGSLPAVTGNAGKYVYTDGVTSTWRFVSTADLSDYNTLIKGVQVALAVAL